MNLPRIHVGDWVSCVYREGQTSTRYIDEVVAVYPPVQWVNTVTGERGIADGGCRYVVLSRYGEIPMRDILSVRSAPIA